jgi:DNA-binding FrmR family transcriptional regulator
MTTERGYTADKAAYQRRLRRIEGQVRGIARMVDDDTYCIDILTQVSAATKALQAVAIGLLEDHLGHCVRSAVAEGGDDAQVKLREASDAIARLVRS